MEPSDVRAMQDALAVVQALSNALEVQAISWRREMEFREKFALPLPGDPMPTLRAMEATLDSLRVHIAVLRARSGG